MIRNILLVILIVALIPTSLNAQFATSKYRYARAEIPNTRLNFSESPMVMAPIDIGAIEISGRAGFILQKMRSDYEDGSFRPGFEFGADATYYFTETIVFMSGLLFTYGGSNFDPSSDVKIWSLYIPLMAGYWITEQIMVMAGFQFGFLLSVKNEDGDKIGDRFNAFDFGFKLGAAYQINENFLARFTYYNGFVNLYDGSIEEAALRSSILAFSVSYFWRTVMN